MRMRVSDDAALRVHMVEWHLVEPGERSTRVSRVMERGSTLVSAGAHAHAAEVFLLLLLNLLLLLLGRSGGGGASGGSGRSSGGGRAGACKATGGSVPCVCGRGEQLGMAPVAERVGGLTSLS
jgi:hypothetical protein